MAKWRITAHWTTVWGNKKSEKLVEAVDHHPAFGLWVASALQMKAAGSTPTWVEIVRVEK